MHLTPDGRFLYVSERTSSTIAAFRVDGQTGRLALIGNYQTETQPRGFNVDPNGKYLVAVGQQSNASSTTRSTLLSRLRAANYAGPVGLEVFNDTLKAQDPRLVAREAMAALQRA